MVHRLMMAIAMVVAATLASAAPGPGALVQKRNAEKSSYEQAFANLHEHLGQRYPSFGLKGIDWKKVGDEMLPLAAKVKSDEEFGVLCLKLVARLEDSHAVLLPGSAKVPVVPSPVWDVGIACLIDDRDRPVVFYVEKGSPAAIAGIRPGMAIVSVKGKPAAEALEAHMKFLKTYWGFSSERLLRHSAARMFHRQMERGAKVKLQLEAVDGAKREMELPATLGVRYVPRLPVEAEGIKDSVDVSWKRLSDEIGYIYVRRIRTGLEDSLDRAVKELPNIQGLIVDVRGNTGGGFDAQRAFRNFDPNDKQEPERPRYAGPMFLLIDEGCISAGEGWASWFVARKRAKLFGATTAGASGRKETYTLTNGLYQVSFPVKAYAGFIDRPIERKGLEPDVPVRCTAKHLAEGLDTVLEVAKAHLIPVK
jgi:carboxyl-terminal processing protease